MTIAIRLMKETSTTVLILGGGPAGLLAAYGLATAGVACTLIERRAVGQINPLPRAQRLDVRSLEILRQWGLEQAVREVAELPESRPAMIFATAVSSPPITQFPLTHDADEAEHSPTTHLYVNQSDLEKLLVERVAASPLVTCYHEYEWVQVRAEAGCATAVIRPIHGGERQTITADYLLAADGAQSVTARLLGRGYKTVGALPDMFAIHFRVPMPLAAQACEQYWLFNEKVAGTLTPVAGRTNEWWWQQPFVPPQQRLGKLNTQLCTELIRTAVGDHQLAPEILHTAVWPQRTRLLERFDVGGRLFFIGSAAHQFSQLGDLELNMALQGVHNLVWKMVAVCHGWAQPGLLTTYDTEWRPHALRRMDYSYEAWQAIYAMLGLVTDELHEVQAWQLRPSTRVWPHEWQEGWPMMRQRRQLAPLKLLAEDSERGERRRKTIINQVRGMGDEWFQPWGMALGFAYEQGALQGEKSPQPTAVNPLTGYAPSTWPGVRLPHVWLNVVGEDAPLSTLDLVEPDKFLCLTSHAGWAEAATAVAENLGIPLKLVQVGKDVQDDTGRWSVLAGIGTAGAVLVRPDGHVAWRSLRAPESASMAMGTLEELFAQLTQERFLKYKAIPSSTPPSVSVAEQEIKQVYRLLGATAVVLVLFWLWRQFSLKAKRNN
jgi:2-polyprenyl-6-methoxyphenol hydroxylase-like FAD-dependent oxidoreductase